MILYLWWWRLGPCWVQDEKVYTVPQTAPVLTTDGPANLLSISSQIVIILVFWPQLVFIVDAF